MSRIISLWQTCITIFFINIKKLSEYRFQFFSQIFVIPVKIFIVYLLWTQILKSNSDEINIKWIFLYYLILALFEFILMPLCIIAYQLMSDIRDGSLDIYLIRPMNYLQYQFFDKASNIIMLILLAYISSVLMGHFPNSMNFYLTIYYFLVSAVVLFELFALIGILSFAVENVLTIRDNMWNIIKLFSGALIPLSLYPDFLRKIVDYLPFRYIYFVPINTILGGSENLIFDFVLSIIWILVLTLAVKVSWYLGIKNYSSQGG